MKFKDLQEKISYARSLSNSIPELDTDIIQLIKRGIGDEDTFLVYRDKDGRQKEIMMIPRIHAKQ